MDKGIEILHTIGRYRKAQTDTEVEKLFADLEKEIKQILTPKEEIVTYKMCILCRGEFARLREGKYCSQCYDQFID